MAVFDLENQQTYLVTGSTWVVANNGDGGPDNETEKNVGFMQYKINMPVPPKPIITKT